MGFPEETIKFAESKAEELRKKSKEKSKPALADALYKKSDLSYGYGEAVLSGKFMRWPHEIKKELECFENAVRNYAIAKALGLNPRFFQIFGYRDSPKGIQKQTPMRYDHAFIDVDVGRKRRVLIDNQLNMIGYVTYKGNSVIVQHNATTDNTVRDFDQLVEFSEQEIADRVNYLRTPEGALSMLATGQRLIEFDTSYGLAFNLVKYSFEENTLESRVTISPPVVSNRAFINRMELDEKGQVRKSTLEFGCCRLIGWADLADFVPWAHVGLEYVLALKEIPEVAAKCKDRKKDNLSELLISLSKSREHGQVKDLVEILAEQYEVLKKDDKRFAQLRGNIDATSIYDDDLVKAKAAGKDYGGFLYSQEERDKLLNEQLVKGLKIQQRILELKHKYTLQYLGLAGKNDYGLNRMLADLGREEDNVNKLSLPLARFRRWRRREYDRIMECYVFDRQIFGAKRSSEVSDAEFKRISREADSFSEAEVARRQLPQMDTYLNVCLGFIARSLVCMKGLMIPRYMPNIRKAVAEYRKA
jgi:hypothetical protein